MKCKFAIVKKNYTLALMLKFNNKQSLMFMKCNYLLLNKTSVWIYFEMYLNNESFSQTTADIIYKNDYKTIKRPG